MTFAEDDAQVKIMPNGARENGFIDVVMLPEEIPAALQRIGDGMREPRKKIVRLP